MRRPGPARMYLSINAISASACARACEKHGKRVCVACALQTVFFPVEHFIWTHLLGVTF